MIALLSVLAAGAGVPDGLRPAAMPIDAPDSFAKAFPDRSPLACAPLLPGHALLCFRVWEGEKRRWVTEADVRRWGVDTEALVAHLRVAAKPVLDRELTERPIADMTVTYVDLRDGDGWAAAPLLLGGALVARIPGDSERVAIPRVGVFVAWKGGSPELDQVMAVAVREMFDAADDGVSPMVHVWKGGAFVPYAQAQPSGG